MDIQFSKISIKHIKALDKTTKTRILNSIKELPAGDIKKLQGYHIDYRLRVGNFRVLFSMQSDIIVIKDVLPRGKAYKNL